MRTSTSIQQVRGYAGPAILSYGFRLLFLLGSSWAALAMVLWTAMLSGYLVLPTAFDIVSWHVHELLYGFFPAVVGGFLLTAVPNWTGRLPLAGGPLLILGLIWMVGRVAVLISLHLGAGIAAIADLSFLALLGFVIAREVIAGRNWRNLKILVLVLLLFCGNMLFHIEAAAGGVSSSGYGTRVGIATAVFLIILVGGRIIPSFTRNWLARKSKSRLPAPFGRFDLLCLVFAGLSLLVWILVPQRLETAVLCLIASALHVWRLARWAGFRTASEPLVLILHVGYVFIPLGFIAAGCTALFPLTIPLSAAVHVWTAGAIGIMTLAVMTRASLGHVGKPLHAAPGTVLIYICIVTAALLRVVSGLGLETLALLHLAAASWIAAFGGFTALYGPLLVRPKSSG